MYSSVIELLPCFVWINPTEFVWHQTPECYMIQIRHWDNTAEDVWQTYESRASLRTQSTESQCSRCWIANDGCSKVMLSMSTQSMSFWKASTVPNRVAQAFRKRRGRGTHPGCNRWAHTWTWACKEASWTSCERQMAKASMSVCTKLSWQVINNLAGVVEWNMSNWTGSSCNGHFI